jgi:hypothetical protein
MVLPIEGHDRIGCFAEQVKLTRALVRDLDEDINEIRQLGEHGEEASRKVTELEALCKQHVEAAQKVREEKATLEGMVDSRDELIMEITDEIGLNSMGEDTNDEEEDNNDDGGDAAAPPAVVPPPIPMPPATAPEVIVIEKEEDPVEMIPEQEAPEAHEVILPDAEPEPPQPRLYNVLMRDYEESPSRIVDDLDDLDDPTEDNYDVDEWYPEDGSQDRD